MRIAKKKLVPICLAVLTLLYTTSQTDPNLFKDGCKDMKLINAVEPTKHVKERFDFWQERCENGFTFRFLTLWAAILRWFLVSHVRLSSSVIDLKIGYN